MGWRGLRVGLGFVLGNLCRMNDILPILGVSYKSLICSVPPESVEILRTEAGLVVGQPRTVECQVTGARPNHRVSWWKNGARLTTFSQTQTSPDGATLVSSIVIVPEMTDSEATLTCQAETPGLAEITEHKWQLPVQCESQSVSLIGHFLSSHWLTWQGHCPLIGQLSVQTLSSHWLTWHRHI